MKHQRSIVIAGTGVVALYTGLLLARADHSHLRIQLVGERPSPGDDAQRDLFVNAVHWRRLAAYGLARPPSEAAVRRLCLDIDGLDDAMTFTASDLPDSLLSDFGAVAGADDLRRALFDLVSSHPAIEFIDTGDHQALLEMGHQGRWVVNAPPLEPTEPDLIIVAERRLVPTAARDADHCGEYSGSFAQTAMSGVVCTEHPLGHTAWQLFLPTGPLALLPTGRENHGSFIWTLDEEPARQWLQMRPEEQQNALSALLAKRFGSTRLVRCYRPAPLHWLWRPRQRWAQLVLLGEAARTVHPMAGMGANIGLSAGARLVDALATWPSTRSKPALGQWERNTHSHANLIHQVLQAIRRLSPLIKPNSMAVAPALASGRLLQSAIAASPRLRRAMVAAALTDTPLTDFCTNLFALRTLP